MSCSWTRFFPFLFSLVLLCPKYHFIYFLGYYIPISTQISTTDIPYDPVISGSKHTAQNTCHSLLSKYVQLVYPKTFCLSTRRTVALVFIFLRANTHNHSTPLRLQEMQPRSTSNSMTCVNQERTASDIPSFCHSSHETRIPLVSSSFPSHPQFSSPTPSTEALPQQYSPQKRDCAVTEEHSTNLTTINRRARAEPIAPIADPFLIESILAATQASANAVSEEYAPAKCETPVSTDSCDDLKNGVSSYNPFTGSNMSSSNSAVLHRSSSESFQEADSLLEQRASTLFVVDKDAYPDDKQISDHPPHLRRPTGLRSIPQASIAARTDNQAAKASPDFNEDAHGSQEQESSMMFAQSSFLNQNDVTFPDLATPDVRPTLPEVSRTASKSRHTSPTDGNNSLNWARKELPTDLKSKQSDFFDSHDNKESSPLCSAPTSSPNAIKESLRKVSPMGDADNVDYANTAINLSQIATDVSSPPSQSGGSPDNDISASAPEDPSIPVPYPIPIPDEQAEKFTSRLKRRRRNSQISNDPTLSSFDKFDSKISTPVGQLRASYSPDGSSSSYLSNSPPPAPQTPKEYRKKADHESSASEEVPLGAKRNQIKTSPTPKTSFSRVAKTRTPTKLTRPSSRSIINDTTILPGSRRQNDEANRKAPLGTKHISHPGITSTLMGHSDHGHSNGTRIPIRKSPRLSRRADESNCVNYKVGPHSSGGKTNVRNNEKRTVAEEAGDKACTKRRHRIPHSKHCSSLQEGSEPTKRIRRIIMRSCDTPSEQTKDSTPASNSRFPSDVMRDILNAKVERGDIDPKKAQHIVDRLNVPDPSDSDNDSSAFKSPDRKGRSRRNMNMLRDDRKNSRKSKKLTNETSFSRRKSNTRQNAGETKDGLTESGTISRGKRDGHTEDKDRDGQALRIVLQAIKTQRKKKEFPERLFTTMESEELSILRVAFEVHYPQPPSNLQAQASFERTYGMAMTQRMIEGLWKKELQPWSDRWWNLYHKFNDEAREIKKMKPRHANPTIKMSEAKRWAKEFYERNGPARIRLSESMKSAPTSCQQEAANRNTNSCSSSKTDDKSMDNSD